MSTPAVALAAYEPHLWPYPGPTRWLAFLSALVVIASLVRALAIRAGRHRPRALVSAVSLAATCEVEPRLVGLREAALRAVVGPARLFPLLALTHALLAVLGQFVAPFACGAEPPYSLREMGAGVALLNTESAEQVAFAMLATGALVIAYAAIVRIAIVVVEAELRLPATTSAVTEARRVWATPTTVCFAALLCVLATFAAEGSLNMSFTNPMGASNVRAEACAEQDVRLDVHVHGRIAPHDAETAQHIADRGYVVRRRTDVCLFVSGDVSHEDLVRTLDALRRRGAEQIRIVTTE